MPASTTSGFTLSSIRGGRGTDHSASLSSVPLVAATSPITGQTHFNTALAHPYFDHSTGTKATEDATNNAAAPVEALGKASATSKGVPSRSHCDKDPPPPPPTRRAPSASMATTGPATRTRYETALSFFQRTIIAEARSQRNAVAKEKEAQLALRAAVRQRYTRRPHTASAPPTPQTSASPPHRKIPDTAPRSAWLSAGSAAGPLAPFDAAINTLPASSVQTDVPVSPIPVPPVTGAMPSHSAQPATHAEAEAAPPRPPPPPPLPRAPSRGAHRQRAPRTRSRPPTAPRRLAEPEILTTSLSAQSSSTALSAPVDSDRWRRRHPALRESQALIDDIDAHYPLLRRFMTPPRRPSWARHEPASLPSRHRAVGNDDAKPMLDSATAPPSPTTTTTKRDAEMTSHPLADDEEQESDAPAWLRDMPRTMRPLFLSNKQRHQPRSLYQWTRAEAEAAACMRGPFVTPADVFERVRARAQWRCAQTSAAAPVRCAASDDGSQGDAHSPPGPIRDDRLRALLNEYFTYAHVVATGQAVESAARGDRSLEATEAEEVGSVQTSIAREEGELGGEARTLEALLSFTTALTTPPRPLQIVDNNARQWQHTHTSASDSMSRGHWLDGINTTA